MQQRVRKHTGVCLPGIRGLLAGLAPVLLAACGGGGGSATNAPPVITRISVADSNGGDALVGDILSASYTYADPEGDAEAAPTIRWLRSDVAIAGATSPTYKLTGADAEATVSCAITPRAATGTPTGEIAHSDAIAVAHRSGTRVAAQQFASTYTNWTYPIYIFLPDGYEESSLDYPVIYTLDAETVFADNATILDEQAKDIIMVAVGHTDASRREIDYALPGARDYYNFMTLELLPFIEAQYRIDTTNRILSGHSLGGLFTGLALLLEDPQNRNFASFLVSDGSFWKNAWLTIGLEGQLAATTDSLPVDLIIVAATQGNLEGSQGFHSLFAKRDYDDLNLHYFELEATHAEADTLTFLLGLDILFP